MTEATTTKTSDTHVVTTHTHGEPKESLISNTLAIVGFIIVVAIVLWGLLHLASLGQPWFSSLFESFATTPRTPTTIARPSNPMGAGSLALKQPATTTPAAQPSPSPVVPVVPVVQAGPADLSVQILSVESDGVGGGVATFDIANVGKSSTGVYSFTAQLPNTEGRTYNSTVQSPLAPGDHIVNTLRFSQAVSGAFSVSVQAGTKNEARTDNNYASRQVSMPYIDYNYNPQPYSQYQYGQYQYGF